MIKLRIFPAPCQTGLAGVTVQQFDVFRDNEEPSEVTTSLFSRPSVPQVVLRITKM